MSKEGNDFGDLRYALEGAEEGKEASAGAAVLDAKPKIVRTGDPEFAEIAEHFERCFARGLTVVGMEGSSYLLGVVAK